MENDEVKGSIISAFELTDPIDGRKIDAIEMRNEVGMRIIAIPGRALDLYAVSYTHLTLPTTERV